ncbi:MAG: porin [Bacteroidetes bacterium]|nr:porin [Bacteroidota bacterium]MBU1372153.1 porin [Bacteroidota bacterium]MBU1483369.1 porin [Bacteroidota bacterium]MBU1761653.1 porin [Bacteroidota bacterium]MBU2045735.1 porin [Bacteroidota bacterium]
MKKQVLTMAAAIAIAFTAQAQTDSTSTPLQISGSVDAYWKYDFAKKANIKTSFASDQNSLSLGMVDVALKKSTGKASFVGEVSFGPRSDQSLPDATIHIQNLYATYAFTNKFSMSAGYMGTFVGYEVISPVANFNYSTSYLFTNGPFQNAGIKANVTFSDKVGVMVGLFNNTNAGSFYWNGYVANPDRGLSNFGAQLSISPVKGWTAYLNVLTGKPAGTEFDLTTSYQITEKFMLGLNAADYSAPGKNNGGFSGVALYPQISVTNDFALGLRGEFFKIKDSTPEEGVTALTLTANLKTGGFRLIPEIRLDNSKTNGFGFLDKNGLATKSASQFSLAFVYAF